MKYRYFSVFSDFIINIKIFVAPSLYINGKPLLTLILKVLSYIYIILYILLNMKCDIFSVLVV